MPTREGTVTSIQSVLCHVDDGDHTYACKARRRLVDSDTGESKPMTVGDRVLFTPLDAQEGVIEEVLPRRNKLSRSTPHDSRTEHVIVANVDQILVVAAVRTPPLTLGIIDRYVIAGESAGIQPVICINKIDLAQDDAEYARPSLVYRRMGCPVVLTSAIKGDGVAELWQLLRDKTTVLAGHSGVGKSALINAVQPGLRLKTGDVYLKGRHVTSRVSLLKLDAGGYVVDTPGIREFALWDIKKAEVAQFFPQIWELSQDCRMRACLHVREPGCAVKDALAGGRLGPARYESYARIVESIREETVPRATDVDQPDEQVAKKKRDPSRRTRKQALRRLLDELDQDEEDFEPGRR